MRNITNFGVLLLAAAATAARSEPAELQFFGDVYVPERVLAQTESTASDPALFSGVKDLLQTATHNVVNLEGPVTSAFVTPELKRYLLRMPFDLPPILRAAGINVATLANNHAMDFGYQGVFDTQAALAAAGIAYTGAGRDRNEAARPVFLEGQGRTYCLLSYSRTLPQSFWAGETTPGTASVTPDQLEREVTACADSNLSTIVTFHWGKEMTDNIAPYQRELAHRAIKAGARMVLGHHPHKIQDMEIYKGRPILYSLGNFAFGSMPDGTSQEGLAVRVLKSTVELVPLVVRNSKVKYRPRPLLVGEADPMKAHMPVVHPCRWQKAARLWACAFRDETTSAR